jgi:hypothetical protein
MRVFVKRARRSKLFETRMQRKKESEMGQKTKTVGMQTGRASNTGNGRQPTAHSVAKWAMAINRAQGSERAVAMEKGLGTERLVDTDKAMDMVRLEVLDTDRAARTERLSGTDRAAGTDRVVEAPAMAGLRMELLEAALGMLRQHL